MFLHSMNGKFEATIAALKTMSDDSLTWEDVTARIIEETTSHPRKSIALPQTALVTGTNLSNICSNCGKDGHKADHCWWNPNNPKNRIRDKAAASSNIQKAAKAKTSQEGEQLSRKSKTSRKSNK